MLRFVGSIREATINRTDGTWFACFCVEDGQEPPPVKDGPTVGVDVGVGTMATCSDGTVVENPKPLASALRRLQCSWTKPLPAAGVSMARAVIPTGGSGCTPGGAGSTPAVVNVRSDHHHKATTAIAKSAGRVVVETLNVAGMMLNRPAWLVPSPMPRYVRLPDQAGVQVRLVRR